MNPPLKIEVPDNGLMAGLLGQRDENLRVIEDSYDVDIHVRGNEITVNGEDASAATDVIAELIELLQKGGSIESSVVKRSIDMITRNERPSKVLTDRVLTTYRGKPVKPKTAGQKQYVDAIRRNLVTFGIGPAGTGKSWLAVASAVAALQDKQVERILLTRPAVEAGERLGYLPGDLMDKVDPYLRPLYDALHDMVGADQMSKLFERNVVEVAPLAFMRGRTLNDSFIILDEAQNTTPQQMMMFLTRIGFNSRAVITGDTTQVDVSGGKSGLDGLEPILGEIDDLDFVRLTSSDVVRHRIVQDIVDAYARNQNRS